MCHFYFDHTTEHVLVLFVCFLVTPLTPFSVLSVG